MSSSPTMKLVQLTPDRSLLDPKFESYKLSLDPLPAFQSRLPSPLSIRTCSDDQYSFLHARLFGQTNVLVHDPCSPNSVFLLDTSNGIQQICRVLFEDAASSPELIPVFTLPSGLPQNSGEYNMSLAFAGDSLAIVSDGSGVIYILDTGDRQTSSGNQWKLLFHDEICGKARPFVVVSAAVIETTGDAERVLHCLLNYVQEKALVEGLQEVPEKVNFINVVEWMTFASGSECWGLDRVRRYAFLGGIDYLQLDKSASHLICATEKPFHLVFDSTGTMEVVVEENGEVPTVVQRDPEGPPPKFFWQQGVQEILVWVVLPEGVGKRDLKVDLKPRALTVKVRGELVAGGDLWDVLDSDSMTWTIERGKLEISVCKANGERGQGLIWQRLLKSSEDDGMEIMHGSPQLVIDEMLASAAAAAAAAKESNVEPLPAYNAQELEDCDAMPDDSFAMFVVDAAATGKDTFKVPLSGHQWLFNVPSVPAGIGLRHDVDALVWRPNSSPSSSDSPVSFEHFGTFSALGYVQASKAQRKFTAAAPNLSYAVIAEVSRRVFVYRQPSAIPSEFDVRNRKSGQKVQQVAKQQVVTLEGNDDILGVAATDGTLMVVTTSTVFCFRIN